MNEETRPQFSVSISEEFYGDNAPITLQGGLIAGIEKAARLGFDSVEMHIHTPAHHHVDRIAEVAEHCGVTVSAIGTGLEYTINGLCFTSPDNEVRSKTQERFKEHIDVASTFNAVVFLGLCRGTAPSFDARDEYLDRLAREFILLAEYADQKGVILAFEPIVFYLTNLINTTQEALEFLKRPGLNSLQLLLDTHHMYIEDKDMTASFVEASDRIAHIHISDSNRQYAGSGNVDYEAVGAVLKEIGYTKAVSLETIPFPSGEESARRSLAWMQSVWTSEFSFAKGDRALLREGK